jgi:Bacterial pre-peptidase C-terminal domain
LFVYPQGKDFMPANPNNNTVGTATSLLLSDGLPQTLGGSLSAADPLDFYRFSTTAASNLKLTLSGLTGNARLNVLQADGTTALVASAAAGNTSNVSNDGKLSESFVFNALPAGNYVIKVDLPAGTTTADYLLETIANKEATANTILWQNTPLASTDPLAIYWQLNGPNLSGDVSATQGQLPQLAGYELVGSGDFDGISDAGGKSQDLLWRKSLGNGSYELNLWFMNSDNSLREAKPLVLPGGATTAFGVPDFFQIQRLEDFDGDGKTDILFRNTTPGTSSIVLWKMDGATFSGTASRNYTVFDPAFQIFATGDFDANGFRDIMFRQPVSGDVVVWLLDANLNLIPGGAVNSAAESGYLRIGTSPILLGSEWTSLGVMDFNSTIGGSATSPLADKKDDILFLNQTTGQLVAWLMDGSTIIPGRGGFILNGLVVSGAPGAFDLVGSGDFNGDQNADLLWRFKTQQGPLIQWQMESGLIIPGAGGVVASSTAPTTPIVLGANFEIITRNEVSGQRGFVDFDGNKQVDLLFREKNTGTTVLWSMNGNLLNPTKSGEIKTPDGAVPSVTSNFKPIGGLTAQLASIPQGTSGAAVSTAFNMGTLEGLGNYQDSLAGTASDFYKFKLEKTSDVTIALTAAFGGTTALTTGAYVLSRETGLNPDGTPTLAVQTLTPGASLAAGTYYLEVKKAAGVAALTPVAYNLKVTGEPSVINLRSIELTNVTGPAGTFAGSIRLADLTAAAPTATTAVDVAYTITNTEPKAAGSVTVKFYLSRVSVINPADSKTIALGTDTIAQVLGNGAATTKVSRVVLPAGDDNFWTTDTNPNAANPVYYYLAYEIDPVARNAQGVATNQGAIQETFETATPGQTDNFNRGLNIDVKQLSIQNTQTPDVLGAALTGPATIARGGTIDLNYTIQNAGRKATGQQTSVAFFLYRSSTDTTLPQAQRDSLVRDDATRTIQLGTFDDANDANLLVPSIAGLASAPAKAVRLQLPGANSPFWQNATPGTQYFIGMIADSGEGIAESIEDNNLNVGLGRDRLSVTLA